MQVYSAVVGFFQDGGPFMYPIGLILAAGVAIAIERYLFLVRAKRFNGSAWEKLMPLIRAGNFQEAGSLTGKSQAAVARIVSHGLVKMKSARSVGEIETALEEGLLEVMPHLEKRTHYLATFANVATLLGLLGQAFTAVAQADAAQKADLLSSSISVAMNTTAFGLMVAIPLLLIHSLLQTKTNEIVDGLEVASVKFLNAVSGETVRPEAA